MEELILGHFAVLEKIGEGGMGVVYKARDLRLERTVAIKALSESRSADSVRKRRLIQEAKAASALNHPNIVTIHEIIEQDGRSYIVMELIEGTPLSAAIPKRGMKPADALRIAVSVGCESRPAASVWIRVAHSYNYSISFPHSGLWFKLRVWWEQRFDGTCKSRV